MTNYYPFFIGLRFFTSGSRNQLASFISVLAISGLVLGVAMLIIVLSVMNGFDREMRTRVLAVVPHIQIFAENGIGQWREMSAKLASHPAVLSVTPFTQIEGIVNFRGRTEAIQLRGITPFYAGSTPDSLADVVADIKTLSDNEIMLSRFVAEKLGVDTGEKIAFIAPQSASPAGEPLRGGQLPQIRVFEITGLFATGTAMDAHLGLINLPAASNMAGLGAAAQGLKVAVTDVFAARQVAFELLDRLPEGYTFVDWMQTHGNLYQAIQMSRKLVGLLVFLIIAIAAFNVVAMLIMTVVDKRPEIAILKTQGASSGHIMAIFLTQGALIGLFGALFGVALGSLGAWLVSDIVSWLEGVLHIQFLNLDVYPIDYVPSDLRLGDVAQVVLVALVLNLAATLYPAWQAARVQPAVVLRYE